MLDSHRRRRPFRALAYLLLGTCGAILQYDPTRNVAPLPFSIRWVWSSFLVVGALVSMYGAVRDRWIGEFVGIPLLGSGLAALIWVLVSGGGSTGRLAFACIIGSVVVTLGARWYALWDFVLASRKRPRQGRRGRRDG